MGMLKRLKNLRNPGDLSQFAGVAVDTATRGNGGSMAPPTREQISSFMAEMGRKGGKIGGKRRLTTLTARERSEIARKAARTRWEKSE